MNLDHIMPSKMSPSQRDEGFHLYEVSVVVRLLEAGSGGGCQELGEEGNEERLLSGPGGSCEMKKSWSSAVRYCVDS